MEKRGLSKHVLKDIEEAGVNVAAFQLILIPKLRNIRERNKKIRNAISIHGTPLRMSKKKKLSASSKKKGFEKLSQWVPSITNHFWWSLETCH